MLINPYYKILDKSKFSSKPNNYHILKRKQARLL
jgi:hypothetical protein